MEVNGLGIGFQIQLLTRQQQQQHLSAVWPIDFQLCLPT